MEEIVCCSCGDVFERSVAAQESVLLSKAGCQRARKAAWKRYKMRTDADYQFNQTAEQQKMGQSPSGLLERPTARRTRKKPNATAFCNRSATAAAEKPKTSV